MKVAILRLNAGDFGKVGYYNVQEIGLARVLRKSGHNPIVIYLDKNISEPYRLEEDNVIYIPCKSIGVHGMFDLNILKAFEIDGLILFADNQLWQKNVIKWCASNGVKCINYMGRVDTQLNKFKNKIFYKYLLLRNSKPLKSSINVTKTSGSMKSAEKMKIPIREVVHVGLDMEELNYNDFDKKKLREKLGLPLHRKILIFVGRLERNKNPLFSIDLLKEMLKKSKDYHLIIVGKGSLKEEVLGYAKKMNIENNFSYFESICYSEMHEYYKVSDCFVNPCETEIFGMAILESMFYKCPVVAMAADGPRDIIDSGIDGYICNDFKLTNWVDHIEYAVDNNELVQNAHDKIVNHFNWNVSAKKFEALLKEDFN